MTLRTVPVRLGAAVPAALLLFLLLATTLVATPAAADEPAGPSVQVSKTTGLNGEGETVTITGTGFVQSEAGPLGTRPPLAGLEAGAYVVFGKFSDDWAPSLNSDTAVREIMEGQQKWVMNADYLSTGENNPVPPHFQGSLRGSGVALNEDGSFELTLTVADFLTNGAGNYGIYTYAASGAKYAPYETYTPLSFTPATPKVSVSQTENLNGDGQTVTVTGSGFNYTGAPVGGRPPLAGLNAGAYVVFGKFSDDWAPSLDSDTAIRTVLDGQQKWAMNPLFLSEGDDNPVPAHYQGALRRSGVAIEEDGTFELTLEVADSAPNDPGTYGIYTYAASGATYVPWETATPLTFDRAAPSIQVSKTTELDGEGETVTITGSGFYSGTDEPAGTRPPLAGLNAGAYVVFGKFSDDWAPSLDSDTAVRTVLNGQQKWAMNPLFLSDSDDNPVPPELQGMLRGSGVPVSDDGTFELTLEVADSAPDAEGTYGIYTYAGSGAKYSPWETATSLSFAGDTDPGDGDGDGGDGGDGGSGGDGGGDATPTGSMTWGIHTPFLNYIENGAAHGSATTKAPATRKGDLFTFVQSGGNANASTYTGTAKYAGSVVFSGHEGALSLTLANPQVTLNSSSSAVLSASVDGNRVNFANLTLGARSTKDGATTFTAATAKLTAAGVEALNNAYAQGTVIAPVTFTVGGADDSTGGNGGNNGGNTGGNGGGSNGGDGGTGGNNGGNTGGSNGGNTGGSNGGGTGTPGTETPGTNTPGTNTAQTVGRFTWGVHSGFRDYVTGSIAQGSISVSGASWSGSSATFVQSGGDADALLGTGTATYGGSLTFSGHHGALWIQMSNPQVRLTGTDSAMLSLNVNGTRVDFASIDLGAGNRTTSGNAIRYEGAPTTLTAAGARYFTGFYSAGERMSPVTVTFGVAAIAAPSGGGSRVVAASVNPSTSTPGGGIPDEAPASDGIVLDDVTLEQLLAGETVTITVNGFEPNESGIAVVLYSTPTVLASGLTADASGAVSWTGALPASMSGQHTLTFQGSVAKGIVLDIPTRASIEGMCVVDSPAMQWGVKVSFRSYLESNIANGEWELTDVTETGGIFTWADGSGAIDPESLTGAIEYSGSIRFTGHEGALDTTISNPVIELSDAGSYLLLDVSGETQGGEAVTAEAIRFATLDMDAATIAEADGIVTVSGVPTTLTAEGAAAFGTYPEGEAFDDLEFALTSDNGCVAILAGAEPVEPEVSASPEPSPEATDVPATTDTTASATETDESSSWWLWAVIAVVVIAGIATVAVIRSRKAG